jgi:mono/diheme cytochrome c family protein
MKTLRCLLSFLVLAAVAAGVFVYSGIYNVAADQAPSELEDWLLSAIKERSIDRRASGIEVPPLDDEAKVRRGFELFRAHCVTCHGAPGVDPDGLAMGFYPVPPRLDLERVQHESDAELFWVVRNGIKFTGMPGFNLALDGEEDLWALVAFLRRLPDLDPKGFEAMAREGEPAAAPEAPGETPPVEANP